MTVAVAETSIETTASSAADESLQRFPWKYRAMIRKVRELEPHLTALSDKSLRQYVNKIRTALRDADHALATSRYNAQAQALDKHLPAVFACVCVAARRTLNLRPYNVQLIGGYELHRGAIAEMATGEGKTLVATLPATLNALTGKGVHIVTVNDYLAKRDAEIMSPIYNLLGLTVGVIVSGMDDDQRRAAYRADILYGTNKELGFDYLRDQIKLHDRSRQQKIDAFTLLNRRDPNEPVMRQLNFAVVDEADSILIDESRTPLIISAPSGPSPLGWAYEWANTLAQRFRARHDFEFEPENRKLDWKEEGLKRLTKILADTNTPSITTESWQNLVLNALRARHLFLKEQHYVLTRDESGADEVVIVDEFTGRRMPGRTWSEGLHQAVQAKEKIPIHAPAKTLARTTYQHFFSLYKKLSGMTGTAATETWEFRKVYKLPVVRIMTHRPVRRERMPDRVFRTTREKWHAVAEEILAAMAQGRPVLVGTSSIDDSEALSKVLHEEDIPHQILNARPENAAREAEIVANAGHPRAVTIATNMAGRGTDIKLASDVLIMGGLHVIGTQRHESRRVDNQLIGRCGRQGDPGTAVFFLSLEDPILQHHFKRKSLLQLRRRSHGRWGHEIKSTPISLLFEKAQLKVESLHFRQRQQLMEYEDWLNKVYYQMGGN
ncbi:MAG TPA: DEAD/DEAH box helicase [Phycisphaerae bacterium]|nr:DEAD/DEAH box helicase [Phycisphaerae bacterium]